MNTLARVVSFVSAVGIACLVTGAFLWQYGARGLWLPPCAAIGALIAILISHVLFSRAMMGIASIAGAVIGSMIIESGGAPCIHSEIPAAPYIVFVGAVLGAAVWVIRLSIRPFNKGPEPRKSKEESDSGTVRWQKTSEYLLVSLSSFVIGPVLGLVYFFIEYVSGSVEPLDKWPVLGYQISGPLGALLCAMSFGAIGALLLGIPYFMAWWIQVETEKVTAHVSGDEKNSRKQPP